GAHRARRKRAALRAPARPGGAAGSQPPHGGRPEGPLQDLIVARQSTAQMSLQNVDASALWARARSGPTLAVRPGRFLSMISSTAARCSNVRVAARAGVVSPIARTMAW